MTTFTALRDQLPADPHERGKQFERVCKWFLETDPRYSNRLAKVWLWDDWPHRWGPDCGIDLVAEDRDGKNWAIQAKCYDPKYSVTKSDVDKWVECDDPRDFCQNDDQLRNYYRNRTMVDLLHCIPEDITESILHAYHEAPQQRRKGVNLLSYFTSRRLKNLLENIQEF